MARYTDKATKRLESDDLNSAVTNVRHAIRVSNSNVITKVRSHTRKIARTDLLGSTSSYCAAFVTKRLLTRSDRGATSPRNYQREVMQQEKYAVRLKGLTDLVLHNNVCVDPLHPMKKEISAITSKKSKVDADHIQLRKLEFIASLYHNERLGPYIPSQNLRKMLIEGARKEKNGKQFESGCYVLEHAAIQYDGPRDIEGMIKAGDRFVWTTPCGNQQSTIMRTRARFSEWEVVFEVIVETSLVNLGMLESALKHAEIGVGICDGRSIGMGRFRSEVLAGVSA